MDAGHLDMLHDGADVGFGTVAQGVKVKLHGPLEESIEIYRVIRRDLSSLCHIPLELAVVVDDAHAAPAEHVARAHEQREADLGRNLSRLLEGCRLTSGRIGDVELVAHGAEPVAVLGKVDGLGLRAHDVDAGFLQGSRQLQRGLPAQRDHHALGLLDVDDVHDILEGERLKYSLSEVS